MQRFDGKVALITGAASGQGEATAYRLADEGASLFLCDINEAALGATTDGIRQNGASVKCMVCDVSKAEDVDRMVDNILSTFGRIDVLINNAGIYESVPFLEISEASWDRMIEVNLTGAFFTAQRVANEMVKTGGGAIVNTSSTYGLVGETEDNCAHYSAAKGALAALTRQMAVELADHNIRVNAVCPGVIDTPMCDPWKAYPESWEGYLTGKILLKRAGKPEEVAAAHAFLASEDASFITGTLLVIDGGQLAV